MAEVNRGLGRGLDALIKSSSSPFAVENGGAEVTSMPLSEIKTNPKQPRKNFDPGALSDLANSIKTQGILQPLMVRPLSEGGFELVVGERRLRAASMVGLKTVPVIVRQLNDEEALFIALVENLQRENLNPIEEAEGYKFLRDNYSLSQEEISARVGKNRATVANTLRLLQLPAKMQAGVQNGTITPGHARCLLAVGEGKIQEELNERIVRYQCSVRQAEQMVSYYRVHGMLPDEGLSKPAARKIARLVEAPPDEELLSLQQTLLDDLPGKSKLYGTMEKGRLTLYYDSPEQLRQLIKCLQKTEHSEN